MKLYALLAIVLTAFSLQNCGDGPDDKENLFSITIKSPKKAYTVGDVLSVSLTNKKNKTVDSVAYFLQEERLTGAASTGAVSIDLTGQKLGQRTLLAKVYSEGNTYEASKTITILSSITAKLYTYEILEEYPHDIEAYTQGLEFHNDTLYESTGQYKKSSLRKTDYISGTVLQNVPLEDNYFGEGLTIMNDKLYQLTWKENTGFIYNLANLERTGTFVYGASQQGWGLCNDGTKVFKSDGTERIWTLNANTLAEEDYIEIYTSKGKIKSVNELEWVDGKIYANVYEQSAIAIIDPASGAVEGVIDLSDLKDNVTQHPKLNVLNGIAYNGEEGILYVTGKNWDKLFKIKVVEK